MSEVMYIHQTFTGYVSNQCTHFVMPNMPNVTAGYGSFSDLMRFLGIVYYYMFETCYKL